jgi:hypothetical protein
VKILGNIFIVVIGTLFGYGIGCLYDFYHAKTVPGVTSKTISGAPLTVQKTTVNNSGATIQADYSGAGSSEIFVPAETIPQAADWMHKNIGLSCAFSVRRVLYPQISYRFGSFNVFAGGRIPVMDMSARTQYDAYAGAGVWW